MAIEQKFADKSARVILVDSSGAVRQLLNEVAKTVGLTNTQAVASIQDAHNILETEQVDWLIVPLSADQEINGLHTVRMTVNFAQLRGVRVSLLLDEKELNILPRAFENGLLSYHLKPFTKDSLTKDFEDLFAVFEANSWDGTRTSAEYLRRYLRGTNQAADLLSLEKTLLELYPGTVPLLVNLAHAQHLNGNTDTAKMTLKQAKFIDPKYEESVKAKAQELFGASGLDDAADGSGSTGSNVLGINTVLVIDADESVRAATKAIFAEIGVPEIHEFADGEEAWGWIDANPEPNLIVTEWRIPKLTGPLFIQRIRSKGFLHAPIIVQSSLIKPMDMPIIREMGVANLVQKPVEREQFLKSIIWTVQQDRLPTEQQTMENKIRSFLGIKNMVEAEPLIARYLDDPSIAAGRKNVIRAEFAFAKDRFEEARDHAIEALKGSNESIFALNILGKSLMILRQFEQALKCFQKAQSLSPMNLERLVMIAETQAEIGEAEAAQDSVNKAKDIDPDSSAVAEGQVKVAIASGAQDNAKNVMGQLESIGNVISYLNNKAVAHAKCGYMDEGIDLYMKTLAAVPPEKKDIQAIVQYNMALAKIRKGDNQSAVSDLDAVIALNDPRVHKKASSLKDRLEKSIGSGSVFSLKEGDTGPSSSESAQSQSSEEPKAADSQTLVSFLVETVAGDHCCYLVYKTTATDGAELQRLMKNPPKFKQRKTLERGETFAGADGTSQKAG